MLGAALGGCRCCAGAGCHQELPYSPLTAPSCRRNSLETLNLPQKCSGRHSQVIFLPRTLLTDRNRAAHVRARRLGEVSQGSAIALLLPGLSEPAPQDVSLHPQQNLPFFFFFFLVFLPSKGHCVGSKAKSNLPLDIRNVGLAPEETLEAEMRLSHLIPSEGKVAEGKESLCGLLPTCKSLRILFLVF